MLEEGVKIFTFIFTLRCCEALLQRSQFVGLFFRVDESHVKHVVFTSLTHVPDEKVFPSLVIHRCPRIFVGYSIIVMHDPTAPDSTTWCDEGFIAHTSLR